MKLIDNLKSKFKSQNIKLPDGSVVKVKVCPKLGNKTKATITWEKKVGDVDIQVLVQGQPIRCFQEGVGVDMNSSESFRAEASAIFKF